MKLLRTFWNSESIPEGARVLTRATAIRYIGWGFAESLIPVLLFSFTGSFAEAGLLRSVYDIAFVLALPIVGMYADRIYATTLISIGLVLYLFVGAGYFLAGATGIALFIVIARFINGVSFALDTMGRETYFRRHVPQTQLATVFGYFDSVSNFWWTLAAISGIFLVPYVPIHVLLFLIAPTSLIALYIVRKFRRNENKDPVSLPSHKAAGYVDIFKEIGGWNWKLRGLSVFSFFIAFAGSVVGFFLPIETYLEGGDLGKTILVGVVFTVPSLFGWILGKWFDKKGPSIFVQGLFVFSLLLLSLFFIDTYVWKLIVSFGVAVILEILSIGSGELITVYANPEHYGRVGGLMKSITDIGNMAGPLMVGILMDRFGIQNSFLTLAVFMLIIAFFFRIVQNQSGRIVATNMQ